VLSDFCRVRACIERRNGVLRRYSSLTVARGWKETAAWQGYLSVLSIFVLALSNMERFAQRDRNRRQSSQRRFARLCLIAGYAVERVQAREKRAVRSKCITAVEG
jgi:hypothetical protein